MLSSPQKLQRLKMSDITAKVRQNELVKATVDDTGVRNKVSAVGIQGISATQTGMDGISDVDATGKENGSVLVYKTVTSKWTATRTLDLQIMEGGEF